MSFPVSLHCSLQLLVGKKSAVQLGQDSSPELSLNTSISGSISLSEEHELREHEKAERMSG